MGSIYSLRSGATALPEDSVLQLGTDLVSQGGVKDLSATNHFKVSQRAAGANMSVDVAVGRAFLLGSGNLYPVRHTTSATNKTITSNSSGNPRIDSVVLYLNLATGANSDASNVATLTVVTGTPAASPSAPSDSAIQTAVGASNPFLRLADVAVANAAASIVDANITDRRLAYQLKSQTLTRCLLRLSSNQSLANATFTAISWDAEDSDPDSMHDNSTNPTRITVPTAGIWLVTANVVFQNNGNGQRQVFVKVNGTIQAGVSYVERTSGNQNGVVYTRLLSLSANDYIEVWAYQDTGGSLNALGGAATSSTLVSNAQVIKLSN